jgi:hypothetical protein
MGDEIEACEEDRRAGLDALSGWRKDLLKDAYLAYCGR